jgi:hypothetical protein
VTKHLLSAWIPVGRRGGAQCITLRTTYYETLSSIPGPNSMIPTSGLLKDWLSLAQSSPGWQQFGALFVKSQNQIQQLHSLGARTPGRDERLEMRPQAALSNLVGPMFTRHLKMRLTHTRPRAKIMVFKNGFSIARAVALLVRTRLARLFLKSSICNTGILHS